MNTLLSDDWSNKIQEVVIKSQTKFVLVVLPDNLNNNTFYKKIKEIITFNLGIPCQVLLSETLSKFESN